MTTNIKITHRSLASLKLPTKVSALITYAQGIVKGMTNNASFPNPTPTLAQVTTAIDELQAAETAALTRAKGAAAIRNEKHTALVALLQQLRSYIQAAADANVENGASIIQSAGIQVRKVPVHAARVFAAKPAAVSGSVVLHAVSAARRASYEWQYSTDGGKTWITAPVTLQSKTTIAGLAAGATVLFKYRPVTKAGEGDWSQPASLVIS